MGTYSSEYSDGDIRTAAKGRLILGDDGTNLQTVHTDVSGDLQVDVLTMPTTTVTGTVTANLGTIADVATQTTLSAINAKLVTGTDIGDVTINNATGASAVNIQDGGNVITVDGTVTANAGSGTFTVGGTVTANAGTGTFNNQQSNITSDYDTGVGTQTMTMFGIALPASGGSVPGGTSTNPIQISLANTGANATAVKVDGSAVTQPVSGTVTSNIGTTNGLALDVTLTGGTQQTKITDGVDVATVRDVTGAKALDVSIVDGLGAQITSFGGGTQYAEDAALGANPTGTLGMARRDDALSTLTPVEDDAISLRVNSRGALWSILDANSGVDVGDVTINNASGASAVNIQDGGNVITVDMTAVVPGTAATNLGKAEDAAHTTGDVGVMALSVRSSTATALSGTNLDYQPLITDASGKLYVNPFATDATTYLPGRLTDGTTFLDPTSSTNPAIVNDNWDTRADTYTAAGNGTTVTMTSDPKKYYSIQAKCTTAAATAWSIVLEGSLDGTNFTTIISHGTADGDGSVKAFSTPFPVLYMRSRCVSVTLGSATNIITTILGMS